MKIQNSKLSLSKLVGIIMAFGLVGVGLYLIVLQILAVREYLNILTVSLILISAIGIYLFLKWNKKGY